MVTRMLALEVTGGWVAVAGAVGIAVLGVMWFAVRFWLAATRPANIQEVHTPTLDRLNRQALEQLREGEDQQSEDDVPEGLKEVTERMKGQR